MLNSKDKSLWWLVLLPLLYLVLYAMQFSLFDAFYNSRIDPEYVYLLNGMTVAEWKMTRIGHIDHPGTPFQIYTGIIIRLLHFFGGHGKLAIDVFSRPEWYLSGCSHVLALICSILVLRLGQAGAQTLDLKWGLLLQTVPLLSPMVWMMQTRYTPDRFNVLLATGLIIILLSNMGSTKPIPRRTIWLTGMLSGLAVAVKINFLPILAIPLLIWWKHKIHLLPSMVTGFLLGVLPVLGRLDTFTDFIKALATREGTYGTGEAGIINITAAVKNIHYCIEHHPLILISLVIVPIILIFCQKNACIGKDKWFGRYQWGFLISTALIMIMVSKHYKNYYVTPILIFAGVNIVLFCWWLWKHWANKWMGITITILIGSLLMFSIKRISDEWEDLKKEQQQMLALTEFLRQQRSHKPHTFIITPDWLQGPAVEYGLIYGISWVRHRLKYHSIFQPIYPDVLSFEGSDLPMRSMRLDSVASAEIFNQQQPFLVLNSPIRPVEPVHQYLARLAKDNHLQLQVDTTYFDQNTYLISIQTK